MGQLDISTIAPVLSMRRLIIEIPDRKLNVARCVVFMITHQMGEVKEFVRWLGLFLTWPGRFYFLGLRASLVW